MWGQWHGSRSRVRSSKHGGGAKISNGSSDGCWNFAATLCVLGCVVFSLLLSGGCGNKNVSAAAAPPPNVQIVEVIQRDVPVYHEWIATLDGYVNAIIQPQVSGYLIQQNYREGALVRKNDVLFKIDPGQERQGEVLEIDIEVELARRFPQDAVLPVAKGARGADLMHEVRDRALRVCGTIVWEIKNARHWQPAWIDKLKVDQRAIGANLAVLVSTALPDSVVEFGRVDGVWVAGLRAWPALALALREQLIEVAFAHAAADGKHEKMELPLPLARRRPVPPPHRGDGRGLHRAAARARRRAPGDGANLEGARKADRAGARQHRRHVRRGARHPRRERAAGTGARARRGRRPARRRDGRAALIAHTLVM